MSDRPGSNTKRNPDEPSPSTREIRHRFEESWRRGDRPSLESVIELVPEAERPSLFLQLLLLELNLRLAEGEHPTPGDYTARFPTASAAILATFDVIGQTQDNPPPQQTTRTWSTGRRASSTKPRTDSAPGPLSTLPPDPSSFSPDNLDGPDSDEPIPSRLGRYRILAVLGEGGFGRVFRARDDELERDVAIKVPKPRALTRHGRLEALLEEGQIAASLTHPSIVRVYDIGRADDRSVFIVMEYVEGRPLSQLLRAGLAPADLALLIAHVADAAHHAHRSGLVHRDLTPANILVDASGLPRVTDFGLALSEGRGASHAGEIAGVPSFMAPEQIRGEAHRLDGRTDIWALGVILYQGLTGRLPFASDNRASLFHTIRHEDPMPPALVRAGVPAELSRICLKCLSKRMADRYASAAELAEELRLWLSSDPGPSPAEAAPAPVPVPRGLRPLDAHDAEAFLTLLPGPRGRDGLPESIRFWKARLEDRGDQAFPVGLLYGPSGAGKSSFVRAGLLPRLSDEVRPVYVEAGPGTTEARALLALRRALPDLPLGDDLASVLAQLRERLASSSQAKVLLVFDQFEQWLQANPNRPDAPLVAALRQCDGRNLQALILVRDDFWMAVTRLFQAIEIPLIEGANSAPIEPFDESHALAVLAEFGKAWGRLPRPPAEPGAEALVFLRCAVAELARVEGRITPILLCLFAEVVRRRPWTPQTLDELGGFAGIGVTFLSEAFDSPSAPPAYRSRREQAQAALEAMLPPAPSTLRGSPRTASELREATGLVDRPAEFDELIHLLDAGLRLVSPVDPVLDCDAPDGQTGPRYQLSHDFLVAPIRQWLDRERHASRKGRAQIRLASIAASWAEHPVPGRLPSLLEWTGIVLYTSPRRWSAVERRMMLAAARRLLLRSAAILVLAAALLSAFRVVRERERADALLTLALEADDRGLSALLPEIAVHRRRLRENLERLEFSPGAGARAREVAGLLLFLDDPTEARASSLRDRLRSARADGVRLIRGALARHPSQSGADRLRRDLLDDNLDPALRLRAGCALIALGPIDAPAWREAAPALALALLEEDRHAIPSWIELLGPAAPLLVPTLGQGCSDPSWEPSQRLAAAEILADILGPRRDSEQLARWAIAAEPEASLVLLRALQAQPDPGPALSMLRQALDDGDQAPPGDEAIDRAAMAAIALALLGHSDPLTDAIRHRDDPSLRSHTIDAIARRGLAPLLLGKNALRADLDPAALQAMLLAWAETNRSVIPSPSEAAVAESASRLFASHPHAGVHAAAGLLLRRWGLPLPEPSPDAEFEGRGGPDIGPRWMAGPNGHTLVVLPGPAAFPMGSPPDEPDRFPYENRHLREIVRPIAVADTEVTVAQYQAFDPSYQPDERYASDPNCPVGGITWFNAARYCNWLSQEDGLPPDQWCYPDPVEPGAALPPDAFDRPGFRLLTEAEWEYLCRAGTSTARPFGASTGLLNRHARTWLNSNGRSGPVAQFLPNQFGLFDTLGSLWEWCHDGPPGPYGAVENGLYPGYPPDAGNRPVPDHVDPIPPSGDSWRMIRGGVFDGSPSLARSAHRDTVRASSVYYWMGFRVVRTIPSAESDGLSLHNR
ncbi:bifunctional serine/threonine-protein kinase/formylglycine-generating enzyme family protein [Tautonia sociabilis]|uniref:Protein kinase domain-containing protein n=1 Tax=Tautonia sociabilis TaxID=2080755 RepID=A0A432MKB6_9BACT|nr:bifunctional serine/threonine-protein kinase/formylglycine-generating enzyme family protein [Tautonia sociabilis]RUL87842.1 hypothetical protein TsocGM_09910 [Tautonia sociabilis]